MADTNGLEPAPLVASVRRDPSHPLSAKHLRGELGADLFAAGVVMQAGMDIIGEHGERSFRPFQMVAELVVYANIISLMQRCTNVVELLRDGPTSESFLRFRLRWQVRCGWHLSGGIRQRRSQIC